MTMRQRANEASRLWDTQLVWREEEEAGRELSQSVNEEAIFSQNRVGANTARLN